MKILFLLKYQKNQASSRVRGYYFIEELKKNGAECSEMVGYGLLVYLKFLLTFMHFDIVYFQKRNTRIDILFSQLAKLAGKKTFFDIDDAPFGTKYDSKFESYSQKMMKSSSAVIVGSQALVGYAKKYSSRVYLVPSAINLNCYKKTSPSDYTRDPVNIGWIGNGINYQKDLLMLKHPLESLSQHSKLKLIIVGALGQAEIYENFKSMGNLEVELIDSIHWNNCKEVCRFLSKFDIGVYPLLDNLYNSYKCGYKALEYMSFAIATVASPIGENRFIIEDGEDGFLAVSQEDWILKLGKLIEKPDLRRKMGEKATFKVRKNYSTRSAVDRLEKIFGNYEN